MNIEKVAVIGAGVMGAGIAGHITNAGIPVFLLDIVPKDAKNRNLIAESAIGKLAKANPAPFMHKKNARLITPGNIEDHLHLLSDVDWVIEAVIENPEIKHSLYKKLDEVCSENTLISSNTSTLPLSLLTHGFSEHFQKRFMITHFFNPPRYMRLLELVSGPHTRSEMVEAISHFADIKLGKGCVNCKDTPGFIANRIGIYWILCGLIEAFKRGITVDEADAVMSAPMGIPKTGVFGLLDLVGLDLMPHIMKSMKHSIPGEDAFHQIDQIPDLVEQLIADGYTGRKGKGGFYRLNKLSGKRIKESIDLTSGEYHPSTRPKLDSVAAAKKEGLKTLFTFNDKTGEYAWQVMSNTLAYSASLIPEISENISDIDKAMRLGFNWKQGPFELLDEIGIIWFTEKLKKEGRPVPALLNSGKPMYKMEADQPFRLDLSDTYQAIASEEGVINLSRIKVRRPAVLANPSASLWDIGEGVACLEFHTKMNTLDMDVMELIQHSLVKVEKEFSALVIYNDGENFSAGANLGLLMTAIHEGNWSAVEELIRQGQQTYKALKYSPFPVVGAPSGLALGGGCEILLHCDAIQAHSELYIGLVETGVGIVPGWGGCKEYLRRCLQQPRRPGGPIPPVVKSFETIGMAKVSTSAFEAKDLLFLSRSDSITMNRDRLLADAKTKALSLARDYKPPEPDEYKLPGKTARILLSMATKAFRLTGKVTAYDVQVAQELAFVLSGGNSDITEPITEDTVLELERQAFMQLVKQPETLARLDHMLKTGKPLRN